MPEESPQNEVSAKLSEMRAASSVLIERIAWMRQAGLSFDGARDLYTVLGYDRALDNKKFRDRYVRGGIAGRVVDALPKATWRGGGELVEDQDPKTETEFEKAWTSLDTRLKIWSKFQRVDILSQLSTYAVLLIGAPGETNTELPKGNGTPDKILYVRPVSGGGGPTTIMDDNQNRILTLDSRCRITELELDTKNERFGQPKLYRIKDIDTDIHWTRIIHVAEGCLDDEIYGQPALERVWNLLDDLDKVTGGGSEAFWLRANQGLQLDIDKDMDLSPDAKAALKDEVEKYVHNLTRVIKTRGVTANTLGSDVANFTAPADGILTQISGSKAIPKRILTGSEMGELASSQDRENWRDQVVGRRVEHAEPNIVRPFSERLITYNYLPTPKPYEVRFAAIVTMTEQEKAEGVSKWAASNTTQGEPVFTVDQMRDYWYGFEPLTPEDLEKAKANKEAARPDIAIDPNAADPTADAKTKDDKKSAGKFPRAAGSVDQPRDDQGRWTEDADVSDPKTESRPDGTVVAKSKFGTIEIERQTTAPGVKTVRYVGRRKDGENVGTANTVRGAMDRLRAPKNTEMFVSGYRSPDVVWKHRKLATAEEHKFSSTQIQINAGLIAFGKTIPDEDLAAEGREDDEHITVKYGLHTDDSDEVESTLEDFTGPVRATLGKTSFFEGDDYDVLIVKVTSPDLRKLNALITDSLDVTDSHPTYVPHATIAYLKKGLGEKYAGDDRFEGTEITANSILFSAAGEESDGRTVIPLKSTRSIKLVPRAARESVVDADDADSELVTVLTAAIEANNTDVIDAIVGTAREARSLEFNDDQPRDEGGRWTNSGPQTADKISGVTHVTPMKPYKAYHVTKRENAEKILKEGFKLEHVKPRWTNDYAVSLSRGEKAATDYFSKRDPKTGKSVGFDGERFALLEVTGKGRLFKGDGYDSPVQGRAYDAKDYTRQMIAQGLDGHDQGSVIFVHNPKSITGIREIKQPKSKMRGAMARFFSQLLGRTESMSDFVEYQRELDDNE